ncbi:hypothetical protein, partial [Streptomyces noursei]
TSIPHDRHKGQAGMDTNTNTDAWADWDSVMDAHRDAVRAHRADVAESGAELAAMGVERTAGVLRAARYSTDRSLVRRPVVRPVAVVRPAPVAVPPMPTYAPTVHMVVPTHAPTVGRRSVGALVSRAMGPFRRGAFSPATA